MQEKSGPGAAENAEIGGFSKILRAANQRPQTSACAQKPGFLRLGGVQNLQIM